MDTTRTHHDNTQEILYDMISSGTHSSTERITKFMNALYVNKPRCSSLFSFNYRQQTERSTIRGICIGTNNRRGPPQKNVVLVSGVPLQDPSLIGVSLYVSAMLCRLSPMLSHDVSVIPLASPKEYESRWRTLAAVSRLGRLESSFGNSDPKIGLSEMIGLDRESKSDANWLSHENVTLPDLKDTCKPLEMYITRRNKYFINIDVDLSSQGSSMSYKSNSFSLLSSKGKFGDFLSLSSPPSLPLPSSLLPRRSPSSSSPSSSFLLPEPHMLDNIIQAPSIVLELKGKESLDDDQVVKRGEEIIGMLKELLAPNFQH